MRWSVLVLVLLMVTDVWYRARTFAPDVRAGTGLTLWPAATGGSEPLDCDEAAYAYIGHRILDGDVMYRDLTENKPPLGYWLYTMAVALGGYRELAIRVLPIPYVLLTIAAVWWIGLRLGGPVAACLAAGLYVLLSTDPFLFGNGANLEHFINLFSVGSLALLIRGWDRRGRWWLFAAGLALGAAALVKQVAIVHALVFIPALLLRGWRDASVHPPRRDRGVLDVLALVLGTAAIAAVATAIVVARGAARPAFEDIILAGRALATDTLPEPNAPPAAIRWLTGNADPRGRLPWPFGSTDYLVWWGTGSWPLWLASAPALAYLVLTPGTTTLRRLVAFWTLAAWAQVVLPGLYWQHYYLLPTPGVALAVAIAWADALAGLARALRSGDGDEPSSGRSRPRPASPLTVDLAPSDRTSVRRFLVSLGAAFLLAGAAGSTLCIQARDYLGVAPEELTIRYKGGRQWVVLRAMGRDLARRAAVWPHPHLYVWGWQSPLYFYSRLDSPTRHFFVNNLLRDQADRDHPLIRPQTEEIMATLLRRAPELILTGYPPFRALGAFLNERYRPVPWAPGLWVRREDAGRFERAGAGFGSGSSPPAFNGANPPRPARRAAGR
jgi:hypothetical protein